jgi:hypothetical protein
VASFDKGLHEFLVIRRGVSCVESAVFGYLELSLVDVTITITDGREVPGFFFI